MPTTTRYLGFTSGVQRLVWSGPAGAVTAHLWGGGGGRGGDDGPYVGGNGGGGGYATYQFTATQGDILDVAVGGAGGNGGTRASGASGGTAGASYSLLLFNTRTTAASPPVYPTSNGAWSGFLNTYGVWEEYSAASTFTRNYTVNFPVSTTYTFVFSVDNYGTVLLDGVPVISLSGSDPANYRSSYQVTINVPAGNRTVSIQAVNTGGPGGVGLTISRTAGFSGGSGGRAGFAGSSGAGGGGGGATALFLNDTIVAAAGGGAGGGGAGLYSNGQSAPGSRGTASGFYNGQNGQDKDGDGGGGGGGGGGWRGGQGGSVGEGDVGALAGTPGANSTPGEGPIGTTPGGTNSPYYRGGTALGATLTQPSTGGYAVIVIDTYGTLVHSGGSFVPVETTYVRDNDIWKPVKTVWIKDGGVWKAVNGGVPPLFNVVPNTIGVNSRPYS